ncbi:MAG: endonuclease NucS [archaeon]
MELGEFKGLFEESIKKNQVISFFANCEIKYSGRAESELGRGDRLIVIKADNTLLVHQPKNSSPVNYMKQETTYELAKEKKHLVLLARHTKLKEFMEILIYRVYDCICHTLEDGQKLELVGTEKDMSDMIKDNPKLISNDFKPLSREEHGKFGFIDVFGHDKNGTLVIVECKRYVAGLDAVDQLRRYVEKIKELKGTDKVKGIIAAPQISPNALGMLKKYKYKFKEVEPPKRLERHKKNQKTLAGF